MSRTNTPDAHRISRFAAPSDKYEVAREWEQVRATIEAVETPVNMGALVDRAERLYGQRLAWSFFERGEQLTFSEVAIASRKAANALRSQGIARGSRVAMMVPNSAIYLSTWLGLARLGAALVPVNGRYTSRELAYVLKTSGAEMLIIDPEFRPLVDEIADADLTVSRDGILLSDNGNEDCWERIVEAALDEFTPSVEVHGDDILNVQFTSGTTGFPKGCLLPQRYWTNAAVTWGEYTAGVTIDRFLCNQMLFYVDGQFNAAFCLYRGATFYCCAKPSSSRFLGWVRDFRINSVFYFDPLFKAPPTEDDAANDLNLLHIFGFSPSRHQDLQERYGAPARESFGMSEFAPSLLMPLDSDVMVGSGSCGLLAPFTEARLVDDQGNDVERGAEGELIVRSPAMMKGYVNNPEATAETLKDGWLHTGDLFRQDDAGFFYIVGRKKDMIRRNAENVACAEVEAVLRLHPQVLEAAVVAVPDEVMGEEIKAYLQLRPDAASQRTEPTEVLAFCSGHLASFKIPRYVAFVDGFPMTESARVAKKELIKGCSDLRLGAYDRVEGQWITS
ncbi:class I adenylate-forming enzyme family protein [Streptomyces phaeochromogenes]|uniref:class I adenylate-forming enzyme family protein n=1 Tax=Streptomyces phaeochromogenes TaxID=1923 RepID=UPI002DD903CB|nr:AMP-binding protein [Streptomyces phaeochromogenes]WRZ34537.1 AMP-binding protein [Streptomyces phaeochromogenes]